jgi:hypothetical protein
MPLQIVTINGLYAQWEDTDECLTIVPLMTVTHQEIIRPVPLEPWEVASAYPQPQLEIETVFAPQLPTSERCVEVYESIPKSIRNRFFELTIESFPPARLLWVAPRVTKYESYGSLSSLTGQALHGRT